MHFQVKKLIFETRNMKHHRSVSEVLKSLAESSSWHGIPKIASSKQRPVKLLWCLFLLGAFGVMLWQLSELFLTFQSHPVQTTVSLGFSSHRFPAVTFCNLNPARKSQIGQSLVLKNILYEKEAVTSNVDFTTSSNPSGSSSSDSRTTPDAFSGFTNRPISSSTHKKHQSSTASRKSPIMRSLITSTLALKSTQSSVSSSISTTTSSVSDSSTTDWQDAGDELNTTMDTSTSFYEYYECGFLCFMDYFDNDDDDDDNDDVDSNLDKNENALRADPRDVWEEVTRTFKTKFRNESVDQRKEMGHQKLDFISRASFAGRHQNVTTSFTEFTSADYGNCFTMDSPKYTAWRSGPSHGIKLRLNLEVGEYIQNFASGYGVRMVFHEPGTFPMPAEEGLTLSPGFETMIGLRVVNISRLGRPYKDCTDGVSFKKRYNVSYSIASCMEFCRVEMTIDECNCIPFDAPDLHFSQEMLHVCDNQNKTEDTCAENVNFNFQSGMSVCDCISPCRETVYEKTISGRRWPNEDYLEKVLMEDVCRRQMPSMEEACLQLKNKTFDYEKYSYNFIRARIYFEELNYQQITEIEAYKPVRFVSDIGGAMGLFLGASLLSVLEIFQMIMEVVIHIRRPKQTYNSEPIKTSVTTINPQNQYNDTFSPV